MQWTFTEVVWAAASFGLIVHAYLLAGYVETREPRASWVPAMFIIFPSTVLFVGPFTYFGFKNGRPLLAKACLRQWVAGIVWWISCSVVHNFEANF